MTDPARSATDAFTAEGLFPIREVSRATGVNSVTLRAWERRYGLLQPTRTDSGHRLYSAADIELVRSILAWIDRGVSVSKVGKILARGQSIRTPMAVADSSGGGLWSECLARLHDVLVTFDIDALAHLYEQLCLKHSRQLVLKNVCMPFWQELLLRPDEPGHSAEWLMLDGFLRARLMQGLQCVEGRERLVLVALPGDCRELELLVAATLLGSERMAVQVLGPGLSLTESALVCSKVRPQAMVLFSNRPLNKEQLPQLKRFALSLDCPLALAGDASDLLSDELAGSAIACLGGEGELMQTRLQQFLAGRLDT